MQVQDNSDTENFVYSGRYSCESAYLADMCEPDLRDIVREIDCAMSAGFRHRDIVCHIDVPKSIILTICNGCL